MAEVTNNNQCNICRKPTNQKCSNCQNAFYCTKEHQREDWHVHKILCRPFQVITDDVMGRCTIATRQIKSGERILVESPLIWGPSLDTIPVCLGCGKAVDENCSKPCGKCGWPVCSDLCEKSPSHLPECRYTVQRGQKVTIKNFGLPHPTYQCITVLRCLYQKQFIQKIWKKIESLESHEESVKYRRDHQAIIEFIRRFFKQQFTDEEILKICGIIAVNSHEVPLTEPPYIAIYDNISFFEHSCSANCSKSFTNNGSIIVRAVKAIEAGQRLNICYTDSLWGTFVRREHLFETKFFWCKCPRCSDPTEFATYFSAIRCQENACPGCLLPATNFFNEAVPVTQQWNCTICPKVISFNQVRDILEKIGADVMDLDRNDVKQCQDLIHTMRQYLPENHYYVVDVKICLAHLLGQKNDGLMKNLTNEELNLKAELCDSLSQLIKILAPAEVRNLGLLYFDWHAALAEKADRNNNNLINFKIYLLQSRNCLLECIAYLKDEPSVLPEGKVLKQAKKNLKNINAVLKKV